jgi:hypothetical protein
MESTTWSYSYGDMIDMNGDQFPDVLSSGHIQYTTQFGALEEKARDIGVSFVLPKLYVKVMRNSDINVDCTKTIGDIHKSYTTGQSVGCAGNPSTAMGDASGRSSPGIGTKGTLTHSIFSFYNSLFCYVQVEKQLDKCHNLAFHLVHPLTIILTMILLALLVSSSSINERKT